MTIDEIHTKISDKINQDILLNWAGKKELKEEDSESINNFVQEYSEDLISKEFIELAEIVLSVIYVSKDGKSLEKLKNDIFTSISEKHPLLFQGMADTGEKPLVFAKNIILLAINQMFKNEIEEGENPHKLIALSICIDFLKYYSANINVENKFSQEFIDIISQYNRDIIDRDWGNKVISRGTVLPLSNFINLTFEEGQSIPSEENYILKSHSNSVNLYNTTKSIEKNFINFRNSVISSYTQIKREQDLLWWLNVSHTTSHPDHQFYSYKEFLNPLISAVFMANDLCEIESLELPVPNKVKALLLESLYKCFPKIINENVDLVVIKVVFDDEFNIYPNIEILRNILKFLEKYCDLNLNVKPSMFILKILSLVEISKLGFEE
ncbi:hypothetical protein [Acinetobacter albensis]|uniref:Uncharacterized protein n=1 Tax=Acinetobacter albensis TaxID=1673609 RepID=A0A1C4GRR2_9GAMM|nr:hypothetical protein [Acinetobacter albensis]SCC70917.1 hypothetical protein GA0116959_1023 [Acinetobacter albensis]